MEIQEKAGAGVRGKAMALAGVLLLGAGLAQAAPVSGQGTWETTLKARDINGNAVAQDSADAVFFYDTVLDVTWLRQANTSTQTWADAVAWADGLSVSGFTDWRLPELKPVNGTIFSYTLSYDGSTDHGYNIMSQASELAHLFYVTLGNKGYYDTAGTGSQPGLGLTNTGEFLGLISGPYWFGTEFALDLSRAWGFDTVSGLQSGADKNSWFYVHGLRDGDVLRTAAVPVPSAITLLLLPLGALLWARRRRTVVA